MKSNYFLRLIIFFILILLAVPSFADSLSEDEAIKFGDTKGRELLAAFSEKDLAVKYKKLDNLFLNYIDIDYISRFVVGKYWRKMTREQQNKYQELFKRYALNTYKSFPLDFENNLDFKITEAVKDKEDVLIRTYIDYRGSDGKNSQFLVEFRVHKKDGRIMLTDIKVAESSLILSYRNRFYQMIADADEEIDWFLEDFELLTDSSEQGYLRVEDGGVKNRQNKRLVKILETVAASFGDFYFSPKFHQKSKVRQKNIL